MLFPTKFTSPINTRGLVDCASLENHHNNRRNSGGHKWSKTYFGRCTYTHIHCKYMYIGTFIGLQHLYICCEYQTLLFGIKENHLVLVEHRHFNIPIDMCTTGSWYLKILFGRIQIISASLPDGDEKIILILANTQIISWSCTIMQSNVWLKLRILHILIKPHNYRAISNTSA